MSERDDGLTATMRDPVAFGEFYRRHVERIQRFVARRVADPHLVFDLTAEIFLVAIESAHTYKPSRGDATGWLYGIARNVVASEQRRGVRELRALSRDAGRRLMDADDMARMDERLDAEAQGRELYQAMAELPSGSRAVLELVALDGLTVKAAADVLGISSIAARMRLHRARQDLREQLPALIPSLSPEGVVR